MSKKNTSNADLLTVQEAADFLGVNPGTIRRWAQSSELRGLKIGVRGDWRFSKEDIMNMAHSTLPQALQLQEYTPTTEDLTNTHVPRLDWSHMGKRDHFVQFYESDAFLIDSLSGFISSGLRAGDVCIVVATELHRKSLDEKLMTYGIDIEASRARGLYMVFDAQATLSQFMVDGFPDAERFTQTVGTILQHASDGGFHIQAYGEMVAILWAEGNHAGALQLEKLWNNLAKKYSFTLFCAYPMNGFDANSHADFFGEIGHSHTKVIPTESYATLDTTDARLHEIALLQQKAKSLESEIAKRKKVEERKDEFIALASHELKTPVTSLKAYAQVLQKQFETQGDIKSATHLLKMNTQINKLTTLITDLLDISKIENGKLQFHNDFFSIDSMVEEIIEEVQRIDSRHTISTIGKTQKMLYGDQDRIGQVLTNLLTNAIKYSPDSKDIQVSLTSNAKEVTVSVQDFGVGILAEEQEHIFDRYYREEGTIQQTFPGLGLGLYIAAKIVREHQGRIWVESEKGKGSTFSFTFPLIKNK